jgi:hypothetical protein
MFWMLFFAGGTDELGEEKASAEWIFAKTTYHKQMKVATS